MTHFSEQAWKTKTKEAEQGGGLEKASRQQQSGKKTARQRINLLLDPNSFEEIDTLVTSPFLEQKMYTDGVITGFGTIQARRVALYAQDFTLKGGSLGKHHAQKICKIMDAAAKIGCPIIGIIDSGGARIDEGIHALGGYGEIFMRNTRYSGIIPQISIVLGPCAGGAVYSPALTDFIFATKGISQLFITGPQVIQQALHQEISKEALGGTQIHTEKSGVVHAAPNTEEECFEKVKALLSFLPNNYLESPPEGLEPLTTIDTHDYVPARESKLTLVRNLVPEQDHKTYNIKKLIEAIFDADSFMEIQEQYAANIVIGFARLEKKVVAVVANQPLVKAGSLDINASCKAARFINFCDSFSIPLVSLVDIPGFLPGVDQEHNGIIRHGAKLLAAYAQATIPKITVILRKAFGGAYIVMGSKHLGADFVYAWPTAQIAVLGAQAGVAILHGKKLKAISDQQEREKQQTKLEETYKETYLNPFIAAEYGYIDGIIDPEKTRLHLHKALTITQEKVEKLPRKKHANLPL